MSSRRSPSKVVITQGSPRTSSSSSSQRSTSSKSSGSNSYTSSNYTYSNYGYNSQSSATSNMGRSDYTERAPSRPRESFLRVPDPYPTKDGITTTTRTTSRGDVEVIRHEKRHVDPNEPRCSQAMSSEYRETSSKRKPKE